MREDVPLYASLASAQQYSPSHGGFRVHPSISIELRVERRIQPICDQIPPSPQRQWHTVSRTLPRRFNDPSQLPSPSSCATGPPSPTSAVSFPPSPYSATSTAADLHDTSRMLDQAQRQSKADRWLQLPENRPQFPTPHLDGFLLKQADEQAAHIRSRKRAAADLDANLNKSVSLPALHTRFHIREHSGGTLTTASCSQPRFGGSADDAQVGATISAMQQRPNLPTFRGTVGGGKFLPTIADSLASPKHTAEDPRSTRRLFGGKPIRWYRNS